MSRPLPVYDFATPAAKEFPSIITLENTNVCNLRCVHCPQGQGFPDRPDFHATYMSWDVYTKAIDEIAQYPITLLRYSPDGEALIHPQFLDQTAYAKAKGVKPVGLTTNGVLLDNPAIEKGKRLPHKTMMERLLEIGIDLIDISLDAARKESYERVRVGADYHRVWSNIHRLLYLRDKMKAPTKIMLSIIVQPEIQQEEVDEFVKYWTPLVDRVIVRGYLTNLGLTPDKPGTVVDQMSGVERWPCPQFWKRITIGSDGSIRFCVVDWLEKTVVGTIGTHSIRDLWHSEEYARLRRAHLEKRYADAHDLCGPCTDWMGMRWEWGFELAVDAVMGKRKVADQPPPLPTGAPNSGIVPLTSIGRSAA
jgi:pyruvate-formate lyase-activating enzyme